jgi:GxxExxY protein
MADYSFGILFIHPIMNVADLPHVVIGACMTVHRVLGPGLFREAYEECLAVELRQLELEVEKKRKLEFDYRGTFVRTDTILDLIVGGRLLLMVRSQESISKLDEQHLASLLRLSGLRSGLLVNFHESKLRKGIYQITLKRRTEGDG